jgi:hypothetical protein
MMNDDACFMNNNTLERLRVCADRVVVVAVTAGRLQTSTAAAEGDEKRRKRNAVATMATLFLIFVYRFVL